MQLQEGGGRMDGLVLLASAKGLWVCRISEPLRMTVVHTLLQPAAASPEASLSTLSPCASWRQYNSSSTAQ